MGCRSHQLPLRVLRGGSPSAQAGQGPSGITQAWHSHRAKAGALLLLSHGSPGRVWPCPTPPSLGWGYSCPQLSLSSSSPAVSRNGGCLGSWSCRGEGRQDPPGPCGGATSLMSLQTRCFISPRCTHSAPATSPHREPSNSPRTRCWGLPWPGEIRVMCNENKQAWSGLEGANLAGHGPCGGAPAWPPPSARPWVQELRWPQGRVRGPKQSFGLRGRVLFWGKGCKRSRGPTPLCLHPHIPPSGLGHGAPPSPKHLNHEGLLKPPNASLSLRLRASASESSSRQAPTPSWDLPPLSAAN